jgi:hypothetical protein
MKEMFKNHIECISTLKHINVRKCQLENYIENIYDGINPYLDFFFMELSKYIIKEEKIDNDDALELGQANNNTVQYYRNKLFYIINKDGEFISWGSIHPISFLQ